MTAIRIGRMKSLSMIFTFPLSLIDLAPN
jgi:hypothetical protein